MGKKGNFAAKSFITKNKKHEETVNDTFGNDDLLLAGCADNNTSHLGGQSCHVVVGEADTLFAAARRGEG